MNFLNNLLDPPAEKRQPGKSASRPVRVIVWLVVVAVLVAGFVALGMIPVSPIGWAIGLACLTWWTFFGKPRAERRQAVSTQAATAAPAAKASTPTSISD